MLSSLDLLTFVLPTWFSDYAQWWIAGLIVIGGMLIFGRNELSRLQFSRAWAISDVCFAESIRRKVLWVTPFAILGVIIVSVLQHPVDEQEAIRQTIKFCLFASGTLVTITAMILACTNLPKEIESRVIYTIVTKPTTRLEIVLGKVIGFIRVSGLIVLIMGVFTFAFLEWQSVQLGRQVSAKLKTETDAGQRRVLQGYKDAGLLNTQSLEKPDDFQIYNHFPSETGMQWISGGQGYWYSVPFELNRENEALLEAAAEDPPRAIVYVINTLHLKKNVPTQQERSDIETRKLPLENDVFGPMLSGQQRADLKPKPQIMLSIDSEERGLLASPKDINEGKATDAPSKPNPNDGSYSIGTPLTPEVVRRILDQQKFYVTVIPQTPSVEYEVSPTPTVLGVFKADHSQHVIAAAGPPRYGSQQGRYGMQIVGSLAHDVSVADFQFTHAEVPVAAGKTYEIRFRGGIQRGGDYNGGEAWSKVVMTVVNRRTGKKTVPPIEFHPETNRDIPVPVPAEYLAGGDFDVYVQGADSGQWIGMTRNSVQLISAEHNFAFNLFKSLLILWLFSILVVIVAIFTSTFLSWPIAVVLTLGILLGHWGVDELGDALKPGVGRSVATDLGFGRDVAQSKVVSTSVDALAKLATAVSAVLPDLSKFPVMDDITRGVSIPARHMLDSLEVLAFYGLPMLVLSFIILKNKEVAP